MANYWKTDFPTMSYPGTGWHYIIDDDSGRKIRRKDAILITDKYNTFHNMLLPRGNAEKTNPVLYPIVIRERGISNPRDIRPEQEDGDSVFINNIGEIEGGETSNPTGIIPGAPQFLTLYETSTTTVDIMWQGPLVPGSPGITGWKIERESPVGGGFTTVTANNGTVAMSHQDTGLTTGTEYNYRVSAVNAAGTGDPSNEQKATTA